MKEVLALMIWFMYILAVILITCHMVVNYSGWWIFLILMTQISISDSGLDKRAEEE